MTRRLPHNELAHNELAHNELDLLIDGVKRLRGRFRTLYAQIHAEAGLSPVEATVLVAVAESSVAPTVPQIGRSLDYPRQSVQRATDQLVARGLIAQSINPDHKRAKCLNLTRAGDELQARLKVQAAAVSAHLLDSLDAAEVRDVAIRVDSLRRQIDVLLKGSGTG